jgi:DNA-binding transcriptional LysR family regulator
VSLFSERYPDVELSVLEAEPEESVPMLRMGQLEIAIVGEDKRPEGFGKLYLGIDLHHLFDEPRYALLPPGHRLARRKRLRVEDLAREVRIELARTPITQGRIYLAPGDEGGLTEPPVAFRSDDINVVQGMVAAGAGIAVVPALTLTNQRSDISIHNLGNSAPMRSVAAATLAGVHRSPATTAMLELLSEVTTRHLAARHQSPRAAEPAGERHRSAGHATPDRRSGADHRP